VGGSACVCVRVRVLNVHVSVCARMHFVVYVHTVCALQNIVFQRNEKERYSTQHSTQHKSHSTPASLGSSERAPTCRMSTYSCPPMHARAHTHTHHTHTRKTGKNTTLGSAAGREDGIPPRGHRFAPGLMWAQKMMTDCALCAQDRSHKAAPKLDSHLSCPHPPTSLRPTLPTLVPLCLLLSPSLRQSFHSPLRGSGCH